MPVPLGHGGRIRSHYPSSSADPVALWVNPANFNNSGTIFSQPFTPPTNANTLQFSYQVTMDKGWLAFSEAALSHLNPAYTIIRKTYALGGQTIATRISGDQEGESDGLYYIHSDHLGSTTVMSNAAGQKVIDSETRYLPFGDYRVEPNHDLTDRGFTGHKHNDDLGLVYMNARFYVGSIGRFASADTIVPDPMNPQQFNRYTYTLNNPLRYSDPTGHCAFEVLPDGTETNTISKFDCTVGDFQALTWDQRKKWLNSFVDLYHLDNWFEDIAGAIDVLSSDSDYRGGGSWAAYMDAAILQAINDGMRLHRGMEAIGSGSVHGGAAWQDFFNGFESGMKNTNIDGLIALRLAGEQGGVDYARYLPETQRRFASEDGRVQHKITWFLTGADVYRSIGTSCRSKSSCWSWASVYTDPRTATETRLIKALAQAPGPASTMTYYTEQFGNTLLRPLSHGH